MKRFFLSLMALFIVLSSTAHAQVTPLPDLYVKDFRLIPCDVAATNRILSGYNFNVKIIKFADDQGYFDFKGGSIDPTKPTSSITRVFCYTLVIGNKGSASITSDFFSSPENYLWESLFITNQDWSKAFSVQGNSLFQTLQPGGTYTQNGEIRVNLNTQHDMNCIEVKLEFKGDTNAFADSDLANNSALRCFDASQYSYPATPKNFLATKAKGRSLSLTWDKIADADTYEVTALDVSPNKDFKPVYRVGITSPQTVFTFPNDDFYCLNVVAVKSGVISAPSDKLCYGATIRLFSDVPVSSWYFPYLQELQANGIISGYKNSKGVETGNFGPTGTLTTAETLKIAFSALWWAKVDGTKVNLPLQLKNHWAAEYLQKGSAKGLTILKDLANFQPDRPITRGEAIQIFSEARGDVIQKYDHYTANDIAGSKYADLIENAYQQGFISGNPDGTFRADAFLNRAEIVKIISKFRVYPY